MVSAAASQPHILHLIESDGVYGAERVVLALAGEARSGGQARLTIGCLVPDPAQPNPLHEQAIAAGLDATKLRLGKVTAPLDVARIVARVRSLDVSLIHAHGYKATIVAYAARLALRLPILATCHLWFEDSQSKWTYRLLTALEQRIYRRYPRVVAVSAPIADSLRRWGVPSSRISTIDNGVTLTGATADGAALDALRARYQPDPAGLLVVNVGRLSEQKAQHILVDAVARLHARHPDLRLVVLGEGHLRGALSEQIAAAGLTGHVVLAGFQERVADYLAMADVFALPSLDEGLPIAMLEALAAGRPVVATTVGAIPDVIDDGVNGLLVPPGDLDALTSALGRLIEQPDLRQELGRAGRTTVETRFSARAMYQRYLHLYSELIYSDLTGADLRR